MNTKSLTTLVAFENLRTIKVKFFDTNKTYTYKTLDETIEEGDEVIVKVRDTSVIVKVQSVDQIPDLGLDVEYKWVVQKVDYGKYNEIIDKEKEIIQQMIELENQALINNAKTKLSESLGVDVKELEESLKGIENA